MLTQGLVGQSGRFRSKDVGIYNSQGEVIHVGARPQFVSGLVTDLFKWAKTDETPLLIKSAVVHYEIEMIHPFEDGNGRIGRLWQSVLLSHWNSLFAWLPVETMVHDYQMQYYEKLRAADKANSSTVFIEFMLKMILATIQKLHIPRIAQTESDKMSDKLSDKEREVYAVVKQHLGKHSSITAAVVQSVTGLSAATARRYLSAFVQKGLLETSGQYKTRSYHLKPENDK